MKDTDKVWKKFIVLEGIDGSGTTTQLKKVSSALRSGGQPVLSTFEPTEGEVGRFLRQCLSGQYDLDPGTLAFLFAADRNEHLFNGENSIRQRLYGGDLVICDRYLFSSLAYQSIHYPLERVRCLNSFFPLPEFLFFLRIDPEIAMSRITDRSKKEIFETLELQKKIACSYEKIWETYSDQGMTFVELDATLPPEIITQRILAKIQNKS